MSIRDTPQHLDGSEATSANPAAAVAVRPRAPQPPPPAPPHSPSDSVARAWQEFVSEASTQLAASLDIETTLRNLAGLLVPAFGDWVAVDLLDGNGVLRRAQVAHVDPDKVRLAKELHRRYPPHPDDPAGPYSVLGRGTAELCTDIGDALLAAVAVTHDDALVQILRDLDLGSYMLVPLIARGRALGVITFVRNRGTPAYTAVDLHYAKDLARRAALAVENAMLYQRVGDAVRHKDEAMERLHFLSRMTSALSGAFDYGEGLATLARLCVPFLADYCVIDLVDDNGRLKRVQDAHRDPAQQPLLDRLAGHYPAPDHPSHQVVRLLQPQLVEVTDDFLLRATGGDSDYTKLARDLRSRRVMYVPLLARGRALGVLSFVSAESDRPYGPADLSFAVEVAGRAALLLDNARLFHEAKRAVRLRDEFLSIASHELKTPLAALRLVAQGLLRLGQRGPVTADRLDDKLRVIDQQTQRLERLINVLLDVSRISSGALRFAPERLDLLTLLREVVTGFAEISEHTGSAVRIRAVAGPEAAPETKPDTQIDSLVGTWDRLRLEQVLINLIGNALKYGAGKPIEIELRHLPAQGPDAGPQGRPESVRLSVRDHGIGIAPEHVGRIFERFGRAVSSRHYGGFGLSLWITSQILSALGGTIRVESELGRGSCFVVELPLFHVVHAPAEVPESQDASLVASGAASGDSSSTPRPAS